MAGKITATFGADVSEVESGMQQGIRAVTGFTDRITSEAKKSAKAFEELLAAKDKLEQQRSAKKFSEADDLGKVKLLQKEIAGIVANRANLEKGTVEYIRNQIDAEAKLNQLVSLRRKMREDENAAIRQAEISSAALRDRNAGAGLAGNMTKASGAFGEIARKLSTGRILESVLGGVGLGSGFAIAEKAAALITSHWEKAAESAKAIAEYSSKTTDIVLERIGARQNDQQKLDAAKRAEEAANRRLGLATRLGASGEELEKLNFEAQKASLAREKAEKKVNDNLENDRQKKAEEARAAKERDFELFMQSQERLRKQEEDRAKEAERLREEEATRDKRINDELIAFFEPLDDAAEKHHEKVMKQKEEQLEAEKKLKEAELERLNQPDPRRNDAGRFTTRYGRAIVSDEDRARSDAELARNAGFENESRRNRIRDAGTGRGASANGNPIAMSNEYLKQIANALKPVEAPKK